MVRKNNMQGKAAQKVLRQDAPQMPTGFKSSMTHEIIILDFLCEEYVGNQNDFKSFSTIALTKDMAETVLNSITKFLSLDDANDK